MLAEVKEQDDIHHIDLYGGEIGALKKDYFYGLRDVIRKYYDKDININTNFSMLHDGFFEKDFYLSVSYDFEAREKHELVYKNMMLSPVPIAVLVLVSPTILQKDVDEMIRMFNLCTPVKSVELKPYSINQANAHNVTHKDFEQHVIKWIQSKEDMQFAFINDYKIQDSIEKTYNAFSNDHVYITPNGKFGVLEFDKDDKEYFLELDSYKDYKLWADKEPDVNCSDICKSCKYYGHCLTEHYRYVKDLDNGCNGYKGLLEFYERLES